MAQCEIKGIALFCAKLPGLSVLKMLLDNGVSVKYVVTVPGDYEQDITSLAKQSEIPVFYDFDLGDQKNRNILIDLQAFAGLSISFPKKIPANILSSFPGHGFNFHPARLPAYRGCLPTVWPLLEGDQFAEYTMIIMDEEFDTGPVVDFERIAIGPEETGWSLYLKMVAYLPDLVKRNLNSILDCSVHGIKQTEDGSGYYTNGLPNDGFLDWHWPSLKIERFIRALFHPILPCAKAIINGVEIEIVSANLYDDEPRRLVPGDFALYVGGIVVACADGLILIDNIRFGGQTISVIGLNEMPLILR